MIELEDFSATTGPDIVFTPDGLTNRSICTNFDLIPDNVLEDAETFLLFLMTEDSAVELAGGNSTVTIIDSTGMGHHCMIALVRGITGVGHRWCGYHRYGAS